MSATTVLGLPGPPTVTIGLPVYNGERYLAQALDALLAQTYTDFELVILDNGSTDRTPEICRCYAARDSRVLYLCRTVNAGAAPNHNDVFADARGRYLKWASHDDLYDPDLLRRCVEVLDSRPDVVLAHAWDALIDEDGEVISQQPYHLDTAADDPARRLRSLLFETGGNDFYGLIRAEAFRAARGLGSFHHADRTFVASLALQGPFAQVPELLYFRRDHPGRGERATSVRARCALLDPRRADRLRNPVLRLHLEYLLAYLVAILTAPISVLDRVRCLAQVASWLGSRLGPGHSRRDLCSPDPAVAARAEAHAASRTRLHPDPEDDAAPRVVALGYFGIGNLGNEASLAALQRFLETQHPKASLSCLAVDPCAVTREHRIPARRLMTVRGDARHGALRTLGKAVGRAADIPRLLLVVGSADIVIVPGSGALETGLSIPPWGLPFWLFVVAVACRVRGRRLALVSVGAQYATNRVTRFFYRWTVRLADYASFRDEGSRDAVRAMGVRGSYDVFPDLAFSLPCPAVGSAPGTRPGHVAVGVMSFYGGPDDLRRGPVVRDDYVARMTEFVTGLVERGRTVTLVIGDLADLTVAHEIEAGVRTRSARAGAVTVSPATTLAGVIAEMAVAECVVASRFHNIVAALKAARPAVSLGYASKNADLLATFGLPGSSQPIDGFDVERLHRQVEALGTFGETDRSAVLQTLSRCERDLERQFRALSGRFFTTHHMNGGR